MPVPTALLNVVGLSGSLIHRHHHLCPALQRFVSQGQLITLHPSLPAVTTSAQATMLTGTQPTEHGIVGNGWYDRESGEVRFWQRSNRLVRGEQLWETARRRDPAVTCANLFWWYNTHSSADVVLQVRPTYKADGRKIPDCYARPDALRHELQAELGRFPLFHFWGPNADIRSTRWIVDAAMSVFERHRPTLSLVYLPHMDYSLQKFGPDAPQTHAALRQLDAELDRLLSFYHRKGVRPLIVSEYGIEAVHEAIPINRVLRDRGWLAVREEDGLEMMEPGDSRALAVADHQIAHVYVDEPGRVEEVAAACREIQGVDHVLDRHAQARRGIDHARAGELVLVAESGCWFLYDWWQDDRKAPDFASTVAIHRKPGYDPRELFIDARFRFPRAAVGWRLFKRKVLGMRTPLDVISLDASLVRGSHGRVETPAELRPVLLSPEPLADASELPAQAVRDVVLACLFGERGVF